MEQPENPPHPSIAPPSPTREQLRSDMETMKNVLHQGEQNREIHRVIIAGANLVTGLLFAVAAPVILLVIGVVGVSTPATPEGQPNPTLIVGLVGTGVIVLLAILSLPFFLAGIGLFRRKTWGTVAAVVAGVINLTNIPLGTAVAVYTFWAVAKGKLNTSLPG